jgi:hypothetical protein
MLCELVGKYHYFRDTTLSSGLKMERVMFCQNTGICLQVLIVLQSEDQHWHLHSQILYCLFWFQQCHWSSGSNMADIHWRICAPEGRDTNLHSVLWRCLHVCWTVGVWSESDEDHRRGPYKDRSIHVSTCSYKWNVCSPSIFSEAELLWSVSGFEV